MSPRETQPKIPDVRLERYRLGELPAADRQAVDERVAADAALGERLAQLEQSDRECAERYPAQEMAAAIRRRAAAVEDGRSSTTTARGAWRWAMPMSAVAAACLCVMVVATIWMRQPAGEDTTIKGGSEPSLVIHRRVGAGSEELQRGAVARQGDALRIGYRASGHAYGAILSIDGRGSLTPHLPGTGERAAALQPSGTVFLDFAYELDDAPRWEAFYFVASDAPFDLEPIRQAVRRAAAHPNQGAPTLLVLPRGFAQSLFLVSKDNR